jgi:predicted signal transduction protein with EAL and GGDEF domain
LTGLLLERSNTVRNALLGLKDLGVELWIDDFGAGHANLSYLQRLTCNVVKIDRGFLDQHDKRRELLGGMISLAQYRRISRQRLRSIAHFQRARSMFAARLGHSTSKSIASPWSSSQVLPG